jgi:hypothetical protein
MGVIFPLLYIVAIITFDNPVINNNTMMFYVLSLAIFITGVGSILTEEVGVKGGGSLYKKTENPKVYWTVVILQFLFAFFLLSFAIR